MYDSLIARLSAFGLAGIVTLSILAGIDGLAEREHASAALAHARSAPVLAVAASAAVGKRI